MKNLKIILAVIIISLINTVCFSQTTMVKEVKTEIQEKTEVKVSDLPEAVTKTLTEIYPDYEIVKAYNTILNGKKVYSISLLSQEKATGVNIDAEGNLKDDNDKK